MVWARLDDQFPQHRKVWPLSDAAFRLHVAGICFASWLQTDGKVDADRVPGLVPRYKTRSLSELVETERWHPFGHQCLDCDQPNFGGYIIHGYLEVNRSALQIKADKEAKAERQKKWREGKDASRNTSRGTSRDGAPALPIPPHPGPPLPEGDRGGLTGLVSAPHPSDGADLEGTALSPEQVELNTTKARTLRASLRAVPYEEAS